MDRAVATLCVSIAAVAGLACGGAASAEGGCARSPCSFPAVVTGWEDDQELRLQPLLMNDALGPTVNFLGSLGDPSLCAGGAVGAAPPRSVGGGLSWDAVHATRDGTDLLVRFADPSPPARAAVSGFSIDTGALAPQTVRIRRADVRIARGGAFEGTIVAAYESYDSMRARRSSAPRAISSSAASTTAAARTPERTSS